MDDWIPVREFPLNQDLAELAQFIQRCRLPLRISEANNCQLLTTLDPELRRLLPPLLDRWQAGEISLADIRVGPAATPSEVDTAREKGSGTVKRTPVAVPLPSWPLRRTPLCLVLIVLCFVGWLLLRENLVQALLIFPDRGGGLELPQSTLAWHLERGEFWRLWSPAMVHFSLPHALFNALGIWILGRPLEVRAGTLAFALLVGISAPVSNLAQYFWAPETLFGGMSGVVYALVGSVAVLRYRYPQWRDVPSGLVVLALAWLLLCASGIVTWVFGVGVANAAHIGGFICGLLLAWLYILPGGGRYFAASRSPVAVDGKDTENR
ncbi:rhomboid family intramembrane serine protease [Microbulbifer sp. 2201CG32-9]|uniref:rhomboid family intramembrane serine protease n=1 Tax=Microbulbifer sp. 2201CG32-9 TaxID=3232309 RepID=UPI00345B9C14